MGNASHSVLPRALSPKAQAIYDAVMEVTRKAPHTLTFPATDIATAGYVTRYQLGYAHDASLCRHMFGRLIRNADEEVVSLTYLFDRHSECAREIAQAIRDLNDRALQAGRHVRVFLMMDAYGLLMLESTRSAEQAVPGGAAQKAASTSVPMLLDVLNLSDGVHELPPEAIGLPAARDVPALDLRVRTFHYWTVGTLHSKALTVDGSRTVIGSQNMDSEIGSELLVELEGPVARPIRAEFYHIWRSGRPANDGEDEYGMQPQPTSPSTVARMNDTKNLSTNPNAVQVRMPPLRRHPAPRIIADMLPMLVLSHHWSSSIKDAHMDGTQNAAWLAALQLAKRKVYIQTPNFNAVAAREALVSTVKRGVKVDLVTSYHFEDIGEALYPENQADGTNHAAYRRLYKEMGQDIDRAGNGTFRGCWYIGRRQATGTIPNKWEWTHIKLMSIDDELAIFGSGNMDAQSWFHSQEINVLVDDATFAERITAELRDQQHSFSRCHANH
ncbi:hypothetical protein THASP1DRAFT_30722 [Thamnocephalis sphaerospora]|uniref:PLD phosphodiesterase domain-containing protein n=1 Tax=Thamnocephalis sphaerospora TaxID=78915 RepID=A0A4P9XNF5_9FUNG|nr:hypothetical protein THASP1DRAFT_30722 [Thamnocephalis sphaerospora]|eukprot:RKP07455.1 hypothetical protein THASP1DRAFT_30722 [Thamnocephalis sphaerospora]